MLVLKKLVTNNYIDYRAYTALSVKVAFSRKHRVLYFQHQNSYYIFDKVREFEFNLQIILFRMSGNFKFSNLAKSLYEI